MTTPEWGKIEERAKRRQAEWGIDAGGEKFNNDTILTMCERVSELEMERGEVIRAAGLMAGGVGRTLAQEVQKMGEAAAERDAMSRRMEWTVEDNARQRMTVDDLRARVAELEEEVADIKDHRLGTQKVAYDLAKVRAEASEAEQTVLEGQVLDLIKENETLEAEVEGLKVAVAEFAEAEKKITETLKAYQGACLAAEDGPIDAHPYQAAHGAALEVFYAKCKALRDLADEVPDKLRGEL